MSMAIVSFSLSSPQLAAAAHSLPVREIKVAGKPYVIEQIVPSGEEGKGALHDSEKSAERSFAEFVWNGSIVLAHHLACVEPEVVQGRVCVEIGAGLGLLCAVACRYGAGLYVATDGDPIAVERTVVNLVRNGAREVRRADSKLLQEADKLLNTRKNTRDAPVQKSDSTLAWLRDEAVCASGAAGPRGASPSTAREASQSEAGTSADASLGRAGLPSSKSPWTHLQMHGADVVVMRLRWGHLGDEAGVRAVATAWRATATAGGGMAASRHYSGQSAPLLVAKPPKGTTSLTCSSSLGTKGDDSVRRPAGTESGTGTQSAGTESGTGTQSAGTESGTGTQSAGYRGSSGCSHAGSGCAAGGGGSKAAAKAVAVEGGSMQSEARLVDVVLGADVVAVPYAAHFAGLAGTVRRMVSWGLGEGLAETKLGKGVNDRSTIAGQTPLPGIPSALKPDSFDLPISRTAGSIAGLSACPFVLAYRPRHADER